MPNDVMEQPVEQLDSDAASNNAAEDDNEVVSQNDDQGSDVDSQEQPAEEDEEIEIGDRKVALPKSLAEQLRKERMFQTDYTQKTQTVAEERKQVAAEREQVKQQSIKAQAYINDVADVRAIEKQLKEIDDMNLAQYVDTDPTGVMKVQEQRRALESKRAELVGKITQTQNDQALSEQQDFAKRVQDAEAYMVREIKGVSPERISAMEKYALSTGMDRKAYASTIINHPQLAVMVHKAELYDTLIKKQAPKPQPAQAAKPAIRVAGSSASVQKDPSKMSDKEFAQWRSRQISQRK
jgi:hypothetical protein